MCTCVSVFEREEEEGGVELCGVDGELCCKSVVVCECACVCVCACACVCVCVCVCVCCLLYTSDAADE